MNSRPAPQRPSQTRPRLIRIGITVLVLISAVVVGLGVWRERSANTTAGVSQTSEVPPIADLPREPDVIIRDGVVAATSSIKPEVPLRADPKSSPEPPAEPSPETRQLVHTLCKAPPTGAVLTSAEVAQRKENLRRLIEQGAAAVPAIREFLEQNVDVGFGRLNGQLLGYESARTAFFDALLQIGGPEATALMLQTLHTTADPRELARLARNLDAVAPELYRWEAVDAAREALTMAISGKLDGIDVGPLFEIFQFYGSTEVLPDLEKAASRWGYYAAAALASLENGAGIPSLIKMTDPAKGTLGTQIKAFEGLAQAATRHPEAQSFLLEQARLNRIPEKAWPYLVPFLAGGQYIVQDSLLAGQPVALNNPDIKSVHVRSSNQNLLIVPAAANFASEQIHQQIAFVDRLLSSATDPAAAQALRQSKGLLTQRLALAATAAVPDERR